MKLKNKKTGKQNPYASLPPYYGNLYTCQEEAKRMLDERLNSSHCRDYDELTMEEKLLVDADVEYLINEEYLKGGDGILFWSGINKYTLEKYLARLRKRDRKNDKRN